VCGWSIPVNRGMEMSAWVNVQSVILRALRGRCVDLDAEVLARKRHNAWERFDGGVLQCAILEVVKGLATLRATSYSDGELVRDRAGELVRDRAGERSCW
jgi:hypothetical protein